MTISICSDVGQLTKQSNCLASAVRWFFLPDEKKAQDVNPLTKSYYSHEVTLKPSQNLFSGNFLPEPSF